ESRPYLARWREAIAKEDPKADASKDAAAAARVKSVAEALQAHLKATLALREALTAFEAADLGKADDRPKLRDADKKALEEIASAQGVFSPGRRQQVEGFLDPTTKATLKAKRDEMDRLKKSSPPKYPVIHAVAEGSSPSNLRVHLRGNPANLGEEVPRR